MDCKIYYMCVATKGIEELFNIIYCNCVYETIMSTNVYGAKRRYENLRQLLANGYFLMDT